MFVGSIIRSGDGGERKTVVMAYTIVSGSLLILLYVVFVVSYV